jgi:hypothetical protein
MLLVFGIMLMVSSVFMIIYLKGNQSGIYVFSGTWVLYFLLLIMGFYQTPNKYILSDSKLYIKRPYGLIRINISDIKNIREFTPEDKKGWVRTFGAEGLFGNFGRYSSLKHRRLDVYTSRDTNWVLIETTIGKKYIISPDNLKLIDKILEVKKNWGNIILTEPIRRQ